MNKKAVVLLSGGIDSFTTAAIAKASGFEIYALSFDYGQRHRRELESAGMIAETLGAKKHLIIKFDLREIGGSALTSDDIEVPKNREALGVRREARRKIPLTPYSLPLTEVPVTYVPARNTIFLSFALAWAETLGAGDIFIGANAVDYSGYPDCRPEFIRAFESMANLATKASVEGEVHFKINAPLINLTKAGIIKKGIELGIDFSLTWSCYDPQPVTGVESLKLKVQSLEEKNSKLNSPLVTRHSSLIPCGRCDSCLLRAKGFTEAGMEDPLMSKLK